MGQLEKILEKYSGFIYGHSIKLFVGILIFTIFISFGISNIELESDVMEQMPQHLPAFKTNDRIENKFSGQDIVFLLFKLDENLNVQQTPKDILDPVILEYIVNLESVFKTESQIDSINSIAPMVEAAKQQHGELTTESVVQLLENNPQAADLVSKDRKKTIVMLMTDVGSSEEEIKSLSRMIEEKLHALSTPPGTKVMITGQPPLMNTILEILVRDAIYTLSIAFLLIYILLIVIQRSFRRASMVALSLLLAIIWTGGTLGWLNIKISFATAGLGAMVLGLGVEYGVFVLSRFREERKKSGQLDALKNSLPKVGAAIIGSGSTTIIGFLALTLSIIPMMNNLGTSLAIGIFYCILSTVAVLPAIIINEERIRGVTE